MSKTADKKSVDTSGDESKSPSKKTSGRGRGRGRGRRTKSVPKRANVKTIKTLKSPEAEGSESLLEDQPSTESKLIDKEENQENQGSIFSPLDLTKLDKDKPLSETVEVDLDNFDPLQFAPSSTRLNVPLRSEAVNWCNKVNLIGSKCPTPIHICDKCKEPILYYGRLIPCKHVFCFGCAKGNDGTCLTCSDKVDRTEKNGLGTIYMCSVESCRRTYLSERDRQAHINHRHIIRRTANPVVGSANSISGHTRGSYSSVGTPSKSSSESFQSPIPVVSTRSNLITVPLQGDLSSMYASHSGTQLQWPGISQTSFPHHGYNPSGRYENYTSSGGGGSGSGTSGSTQWPGAGQSSTHQNPFNRNYYQQ